MIRYFVKKGSSERIGIAMVSPIERGRFKGHGFGANIGLWPIPSTFGAKTLEDFEEVPELPKWVKKSDFRLPSSEGR